MLKASSHLDDDDDDGWFSINGYQVSKVKFCGMFQMDRATEIVNVPSDSGLCNKGLPRGNEEKA